MVPAKSVLPLLLFLAAAFAEASVARDWYTGSIDGKRVGYADRTVERIAGSRVDRTVSHIEVTQQRRRSHVEQIVEIARAPGGEVQRVAVVSSTGVRKIDVTRTRDDLLAELQAQGRAAITAALHLPDRMAVLALADVEEARTIDYFDPAHLAIEHVTIESLSDASQPALHGLRLRAQSHDHVQEMWFDGLGRLQRAQRRWMSADVVWTACTAACDASVDEPYDLMAKLVVRSPFHIPAHALRGPIRYVISTGSGAPPGLIATDEQTVIFDGGKAIVTVCGDCGNEGSVQPPAEEELQALRSANAWVQSDARQIRSLARRAATDGSVQQRMRTLVAAVRRRMTGSVEYLGYATAVDAFETRDGDCTEFALLLAAAARAHDIPARIVIGLAYSDRFSGKKNVFSPHAWVQVWDGARWISYDAGLDGFDATHLAIAVGDGRPEQFGAAFEQVAQWRIEKVGLIGKDRVATR